MTSDRFALSFGADASCGPTSRPRPEVRQEYDISQLSILASVLPGSGKRFQTERTTFDDSEDSATDLHRQCPWCRRRVRIPDIQGSRDERMDKSSEVPATLMAAPSENCSPRRSRRKGSSTCPPCPTITMPGARHRCRNHATSPRQASCRLREGCDGVDRKPRSPSEGAVAQQPPRIGATSSPSILAVTCSTAFSGRQ